MNCGIVGLPNVGKSTIFSALTSAPAEAENYPFCTIEPNVGLVAVPDSRLDSIAKCIIPQKIIPTVVEFVDIAGLVRGASKGEGLGNRFLGHIRTTGIIVHVVRCFANEEIIHVDNRINPISDIETINIELALADLETVEKRLQQGQKDARNIECRTRVTQELSILQDIHKLLQEGQPARLLELNAEEELLIRDLHLITRKKMIYLCNVDEEGLSEDNSYVLSVNELAQKEGAKTVMLCGQLEKEIAALDDSVERSEFLKDAGLVESGLATLIRESYEHLGLRTFFTAGEKEVRAWTFRKGSRAPQAAGIIHSDFERGFIKANVYCCEDLFELGSEQKIKETGRLRIEGKDYVVQDGDVIHFKFNI